MEQQQVQALHRLPSHWLKARHRYVNILLGILREFGIPIALGVKRAQSQIGLALADSDSQIPKGLRPTLAAMLDDIRAADAKILEVERNLAIYARANERVSQLREIPGIGPLTSTAIRATVGDNDSPLAVISLRG